VAAPPAGRTHVTTDLLADNFPLQLTISRAEVVRQLLARGNNGGRIARDLGDLIAEVEQYPDLLRRAWSTVFAVLAEEGEFSFTTSQFEALRTGLRKAVDRAYEAVSRVRAAGAQVQGSSGRPRDDDERLSAVEEQIRHLDEEIFHHWPSFAGRTPPKPGDYVLAEEAFAEAMGLTVEQWREKVAEHKRRYHAAGEGRP
jgi:hypothetical protein